MSSASIERAVPVVVPAYIVPSIISGRVRALVRPVSEIGPVRPGYGLWVKEGITVAERQHRKDALNLTYAGESRIISVPWMAAMAKPGPGHRPPEAMPVQASRLSLIVDRVEQHRLAQVDEETAIASGGLRTGHGFGALGFPFMRPFETHTEAMGFVLRHEARVADDNPELVVVHFRAVMRNIAMLASHAG